MSSNDLKRVAPILGLSSAHVSEMQLTHYDQLAFDLSGLADSNALAGTRATVHSSWVWLAGSSFCPSCLAEDEGVWRMRWRVPWITTCRQHKVQLLGTCQLCGGVPGLGNALHGSAPSRATIAPDGRLCAHAQPTGEVCGADLAAQASIRSEPERLRRTKLMTEIISDGRGEFAGTSRTSLQVLRGWQATIGIAVGLGIVDAGGWGRTHRWANPPREPDLIDHLLATVGPIATAPDTATAADVLDEWLRVAGIRSPHVDTFDRITQPSAALRPVIDDVLSRHGRAHTMIQRRLISLQSKPLAQQDWNVGDIPQLVWPCALPEHLRGSTCPDQRILRAVVALILVRMRVDTRGWEEAGAALGFPPDKSRNWTRYAFSGRFGVKEELIAAANRVAKRLPSQPQCSAWLSRNVVRGYGVRSLEFAQSPECAESAGEWCPCSTGLDMDQPQN